MPVMEGKAALFKRFADIDAWPICLDTQDVDEIVRELDLIEPSPSGDLIAVMTGNRRDQELEHHPPVDERRLRREQPDARLRHGSRLQYIAQPSLSNMVPWMSWSPVGDRLGVFVRSEKHKTLIIQNCSPEKIEHRFALENVDNPESPNVTDGRWCLQGLRSAIGDIFRLDIASGDIRTSPTTSSPITRRSTLRTAASSSTWRASADRELFGVDRDGRKRSLTFGTQDEAAAKFLNADTICVSVDGNRCRPHRLRLKRRATATSSICGRSA